MPDRLRWGSVPTGLHLDFAIWRKGGFVRRRNVHLTYRYFWSHIRTAFRLFRQTANIYIHIHTYIHTHTHTHIKITRLQLMYEYLSTCIPRHGRETLRRARRWRELLHFISCVGFGNYRLGNDKYEQEGQCMSANNNIVVRSCTNSSSGQATMPTLSIIEMHVTVEIIGK